MAQPFGWIEVRNQAQLEWISGYLARKSVTDSNLFSSLKHYAEHGYPDLASSLKALPNEMEYREASRQMKGAWNTHQYRKKNGNPVSLQISKSHIKQLKTLASKNGQSQVEVLGDLISGAIEHQKYKTKYGGKEHKNFLDEKKISQHDIQSSFDNTEIFLLKALVEEIHDRCCFELKVKSSEEKLTHEDVAEIYLRVVEKRFFEIEKISEKLVSTLRPLMKERMRGVEYVYAHIPDV